MPWNFNSGSTMNNDNEDLELRINFVDADMTRTLVLNQKVPIYQLCEVIKTNIREAQKTQSQHYGLFLPHEDWRKGLWLDTNKTLQHYIIQKGDILQFKNRFRRQLIRTMAGKKKELKVDDSWTVSELMLTICTKLGIYNYDEYSLIREDKEMSPSSQKAITIKRPLSWTKDQDKLDKLKKKYHTEDSLNWLNPAQSLRHQGVYETETLLVKRKYFFTDMNVDSRDLIQLNLLYEQLKQAVLNGTHPVTIEEAIQLAGIQCQVQFGNFLEDKFKSGFLNLREFLPKEYVRTFKNVEKKIFVQHSKLNDISEVEAEEKYCSICRSLKTYGITFFLVKEKVKGRNKLIPRLLGVNKDSVVQVDEKSKEIINKWPLTSIRKWAASSNGFTMDFGEYYPNEYYTAQTDKGENISQLIAGYIDIILKRKMAKDRLILDEGEESIINEETVTPLKVVIVEHVPKHPRPSGSEEEVILRKSARTNHSSVRYSSQASDSIYSQEADMSQEDIILSRQTSIARTQSPNSSVTTNSLHYRLSDADIKHKLYIRSLQDHLSTIETSKNQLVVDEGPVLSKDDESQRWISINIDNGRQRIVDEIGVINVALAQIVQSVHGLATIDECVEEDRNEEIKAAIQNSFILINIHLPCLMEEIRTSAYHQNQLIECNESGEDLIIAARRLAEAFTDMIKAAYPIESTDRNLNQTAIVDAATNAGVASSDFLELILEQDSVCDELQVSRAVSIVFLSKEEQCYQDTLIRLSKAVANATSNLIKEVRVIAVEVDDANEQKTIVSAATDTAVAISKLIATTQIVAPTIEQPYCQEQLIYSVEYVSRRVQIVAEGAKKATESDESNDRINVAEKEVQESVDCLMHHLNRNLGKSSVLDNFLSVCQDIQKLDVDDDDPNKLTEAARNLAEATTALILYIQLKARQSELDPAQQDTFTSVTQQLANATSDLIESANGCTSEPRDINSRHILKETIGRFIVITYTSDCSDVLQVEVMDQLLVAARNTVTASTHLINTSQSAMKKSRASNYKVCSDGEELSSKIPRIIITIKEARQNPRDHLTQLELISASRELLNSNDQLTQSSKYMWPTISDAALQHALNKSIKQSVIATDELKKCLHHAEYICQHLDLSAALEQLKRLQQNLHFIRQSVEQTNLIPLPNENTDEMTPTLIKSAKYSEFAAHQLEQDLIYRIQIYEQYPGEDKYLNLQNFDLAGKKSKELASGLDKLVQAARAVSASITLECLDNLNNTTELEKAAKLQIINNCLKAVQFAYELVQGVKHVPPDSNELMRIHLVVGQLCDALSRCLDSLPGLRDIDILQQHIEEKKRRFIENKFLISYDLDLDSKDLQSELTDATFDFSQGVNDLVTAPTPIGLSKGCMKTKLSYDQLVDTSNAIIQSIIYDENSLNRQMLVKKENIINCVIIMSSDSLLFLQCLKRIQCEPENIEQRKELHEAARTLIDSVNRLLATSSSNIRPGEKECDKAIFRMEGVRPLLCNPVYPVSHQDYYACLEFIVDKSEQSLPDLLKTIPLAIIAENIQQFIDSIYQCAESVYLLLEETAQTSYLIGIGDVHSKIGNKGLADHSMFLKIQKEISEDCCKISNIETSVQQIIDLSENISENCRQLCESSKMVMASLPSDNVKLSDTSEDIFAIINQMQTFIKGLNSNKNDENRVELDKTLVQVQANVRGLVELIFSCHFAGNNAFISEEAKLRQAPINNAGIAVLDTAIKVVICAKDLICQKPEEDLYFIYSSDCKAFYDSLNLLIFEIKENAPVQRECDEALKLVNKLLRQVQDSKMRVMKNRPLTVLKDTNQEETYQKVLQSVLYQMPHCIDDLSKAGKNEPEQFAHVLSRQTQLLETMTDSCIGAAAHSNLIQNSTIYLEHVATVLEAVEQLLKALKTGGGNPKATLAHSQIDETAQNVKESCNDLLAALDKISVKNDSVWGLIDTINDSLAKIQETVILPDGAKYFNYQCKMLEICYIMDNLTVNISDNVKTESNQKLMGPLTYKIAQNYDELCEVSQSAVAIFNDDFKQNNLREGIRHVGTSTVDLIKAIFDDRLSTMAMSNLVQARSQDLHNRIIDLIRIIIDSNANTHACSDAIRILREVERDIEKTKIGLPFNLESLTDRGYNGWSNDSFSIIKSSAISYSESLVNTIKELVSKNDSQIQRTDDANKIATTTQNMSSALNSYIDNINESSIEYSIPLLDALHEVVVTLVSLLEETRNSCDMHYNDPTNNVLREDGKRCIQAVTNWLKIFQSLEEDHSRDFLLVDNTISELERDSIHLSNLVIDSVRGGTPSESIASVNRLSFASDISVNMKLPSEQISRIIPSLLNVKSQLLEAISPDRSSYRRVDIISVLSNCTKVSAELLDACKNLVHNGQSNDAKLKTMATAKEIVDNYVLLLKNIKNHLNNTSKQTQNDVINSSRQISELINTLRHNVDSLKEGPRLVMYFRPSSPEWRDVSEKYIGRHVTYHHCYMKSYSLGTNSSIHHDNPAVVNLPINYRNPSESDVNIARKQIRYLINQLNQMKPNMNLIGIDRCTVAEIDQFLSYAINLEMSSESLVTTSYKICRQSDKDNLDSDSRRNIYRSIICVTSAIKNLWDITNLTMSSDNLTSQLVEKLLTFSKKVLNNTSQLIFNIKPKSDDHQSAMLLNYGKKIRIEADLLIKHIRGISANWLKVKNVMVSINEIIETNGGIDTAQNNYEP